MIILDLGFKAEFSFLFFFNFYSRVKHHLSCLRSSDMAIVQIVIIIIELDGKLPFEKFPITFCSHAIQDYTFCFILLLSFNHSNFCITFKGLHFSKEKEMNIMMSLNDYLYFSTLVLHLISYLPFNLLSSSTRISMFQCSLHSCCFARLECQLSP